MEILGANRKPAVSGSALRLTRPTRRTTATKRMNWMRPVCDGVVEAQDLVQDLDPDGRR